MPLPRYSPKELIEELRELARAGYVETFPNIPVEDMVEMDAAHFVKAASKLLREIAKSDSPFANRAKDVLSRVD